MIQSRVILIGIFPKLSWWHAASACHQLMTPSAVFVNLYGLDVTHPWCLVTRILHHEFDPGSGLSTKDLIQLMFNFPIFNPCRVILLRCRFKPEVAWPVVSPVLLVIYHLLHQVWPIHVFLTRFLALTSGQSGTCGHSTDDYPTIPTSYYGHDILLTMKWPLPQLFAKGLRIGHYFHRLGTRTRRIWRIS